MRRAQDNQLVGTEPLRPLFYTRAMAGLFDVKLKQVRLLVSEMVGRRIPPERQLAEQLGISRVTLRRILEQLQSEGVVERQHGAGTFAIDPLARKFTSIQVLIDDSLDLRQDSFFSPIILEFHRIAEERGVRCQIERFSPGRVPILNHSAVVTFGQAGRSVLQKWSIGDPPMIGFFLNLPTKVGTRASQIVLKNREAGRFWAQTLLGEGYRKFILSCMPGHVAGEERMLGAREIILEADATCREYPISSDFRSGYQRGREFELLPHEDRVAWLVSNDFSAVGVRTALEGRPKMLDAVKLVSFDGSLPHQTATLGIPTLSVPVPGIIEDAFTELRRLMQFPAASGKRLAYDLSLA